MPAVSSNTELTTQSQQGKKLFEASCASCHALDKDIVGPKLRGVLDREPYNGDINKLNAWIQNTGTFVTTDPYYKSLKEKYVVVMPSFRFTDENLKMLIEYLQRPPL